MRRTTTLTVLLLGATLLAPIRTASAVGETCRGEAATIVGTSAILEGTEGRDVIVTGSAGIVRSYGGADLICVTGVRSPVSVNAGPGNDTVDGSGYAGTQIGVILGDGADTFHGSPAGDFVDGGDRSSSGAPVPPDNERDIIDSGGGTDIISSGGGTVPNPDMITAGQGNDAVLTEGPLAPQGRLDGGDGDDSLSFRVEEGALAVDAAQGTARLEQAEWMRWSGMENLSMSLGFVDLDYTGSDEDDSLAVSTVKGAPPTVNATLGLGDDDVTLAVLDRAMGRTVLDAGPGRDTLELFSTSRIRADLGGDTFTIAGTRHVVDGIEDVSAFGSGVRLTGDDQRNVLVAGPCTAGLDGAGGHDDLSREPLPQDYPESPCGSGRMRDIFKGGPGNDRIDGSRYDDLLRGGPGRDRIIGRQGRDTAFGGPGRDQCETERARNCER